MRKLLPLLLVLTLAVAAACGSDDDNADNGGNSASPPENVDLVGTWIGDYRYPDGQDGGVDASQRLVIERADGELLFGYDEFVADGEPDRIPLNGSVDADGTGFVLAEEDGFFLGTIVDENTILVRFVATADTYTSFEVELTRE